MLLLVDDHLQAFTRNSLLGTVNVSEVLAPGDDAVTTRRTYLEKQNASVQPTTLQLLHNSESSKAIDISEVIEHSIVRAGERIRRQASDCTRFGKDETSSEEIVAFGGGFEPSSEHEHLSLSDRELVVRSFRRYLVVTTAIQRNGQSSEDEDCEG